MSYEQFFSYIMARTSYIRWDHNDNDDVRFSSAKLDLYSARLLKQQSTCRHVALLWHIILIPSQAVFVLNFGSLAEKQKITILWCGLPDRGSIWGEHVKHYTLDAVHHHMSTPQLVSITYI